MLDTFEMLFIRIYAGFRTFYKKKYIFFTRETGSIDTSYVTCSVNVSLLIARSFFIVGTCLTKCCGTAKAYNTYVAPQAAYRSCSKLHFCITDRADVQPMGHTVQAHIHRLLPATKQPYAVLVCRLMVSTPDYCSFTDPRAMKG